jgi:hypothetical protein
MLYTSFGYLLKVTKYYIFYFKMNIIFFKKNTCDIQFLLSVLVTVHDK